jgi:acetyl-CoA carboxylase biotin carboxyl carrier protein
VPETVQADMSASVWKILVAPGDPVEEDQPLLILESMKMEIPVVAEASGVVVSLHVAEGETVNPGQPLVEFSTS